MATASLRLDPTSLGMGTEEERVTGLLLAAADAALPAQSYSSYSAIPSSPPKCCREGTCSRKGADPGQKQEESSTFTAELAVSNLEVNSFLQLGEHPFQLCIPRLLWVLPVAVLGSPGPAGLDGPVPSQPVVQHGDTGL